MSGLKEALGRVALQKVGKSMIDDKELRGHGGWHALGNTSLAEDGRMSANYDALGKEKGFNTEHPIWSELLGSLGGGVAGAGLGAAAGAGIGRLVHPEGTKAGLGIGGGIGGILGLLGSIALLRRNRVNAHDEMIAGARKEGLPSDSVIKDNIKKRLAEHAADNKGVKLLTGPFTGQYNDGYVQQLRHLSGLQEADRSSAGLSTGLQTIPYLGALASSGVNIHAGMDAVDSARDAFGKKTLAGQK